MIRTPPPMICSDAYWCQRVLTTQLNAEWHMSCCDSTAMHIIETEYAGVRNTLRGLHLQVRTPRDKLVRVLVVEIGDVAVDLRASSPTFRKMDRYGPRNSGPHAAPSLVFRRREA